ncbi:hypothetical protein ACHWQZ_G005774 [Mnemiopsis leidyi]
MRSNCQNQRTNMTLRTFSLLLLVSLSLSVSSLPTRSTEEDTPTPPTSAPLIKPTQKQVSLYI